jgi:hypothetical protein
MSNDPYWFRPEEKEPFPWRVVIVLVLIAARCTQMVIHDNSQREAARRAAEQAAQQEQFREIGEAARRSADMIKFIRTDQDSATEEATTNKDGEVSNANQ